MSLEDAILKHAAAVELLAAAIRAGNGAWRELNVTSDKPKPVGGRVSSADKPGTVKAEIDPKPVENKAAAKLETRTAEAAAAPTMEDLRKQAKGLVVQLVGKIGKPATESVLATNHAGATNVTTTPDEKVATLIEALTKALA